MSKNFNRENRKFLQIAFYELNLVFANMFFFIKLYYREKMSQSRFFFAVRIRKLAKVSRMSAETQKQFFTINFPKKSSSNFRDVLDFAKAISCKLYLGYLQVPTMDSRSAGQVDFRTQVGILDTSQLLQNRACDLYCKTVKYFVVSTLCSCGGRSFRQLSMQRKPCLGKVCFLFFLSCGMLQWHRNGKW